MSLGAYLSGFVDDVAGPDPVALQVCIEARVQPSSSQPIPRDYAFIHNFSAPPETRQIEKEPFLVSEVPGYGVYV